MDDFKKGPSQVIFNRETRWPNDLSVIAHSMSIPSRTEDFTTVHPARYEMDAPTNLEQPCKIFRVSYDRLTSHTGRLVIMDYVCFKLRPVISCSRM